MYYPDLFFVVVAPCFVLLFVFLQHYNSFPDNLLKKYMYEQCNTEDYKYTGMSVFVSKEKFFFSSFLFLINKLISDETFYTQSQ